MHSVQSGSVPEVLLQQGGDLYSALRNHPDTMRWERLGRKVALDVALGINYLHTRHAFQDWVSSVMTTVMLNRSSYLVAVL